MNKLIILFVFLSFNIFSGNGNEVGNGGDVVICKNKVYLLDFFEEKNIVLSDRKGNWYDFLVQIINDISKIDKKLSSHYLAVLKRVDQRIKFKSKFKIREVSDSFEIGLPVNCRLDQIAIQQEDAFSNKLIYINLRYWKKFSTRQKAGLIFHEIIYEHFLSLGERSSIKVRSFNRLLMSKKIQQMTKADFAKAKRMLKLGFY